MTKVYCKDCYYCESKLSDLGTLDYICEEQRAWKMESTFYSKYDRAGLSRFGNYCFEINKNNDCKYFQGFRHEWYIEKFLGLIPYSVSLKKVPTIEEENDDNE